MSSAEYEQVREAVQPVLDEAGREASAYYHYLQEGGKRAEWRTEYASLKRAAMLAVVAARQSEHDLEDRRHTPTWCSRCETLAALRKEIERGALRHCHPGCTICEVLDELGEPTELPSHPHDREIDRELEDA